MTAPNWRELPTNELVDYILGEEDDTAMAKIDDVRARELYEEGRTDQDIGTHFDVSGSAIRNWRVKNGLRPNSRKQKEDKPVALKVPSTNALPPDVAVKVEAKLAESDSRQLSPVQVNKPVYLPAAADYDPQIFEAFMLAVDHMRAAGYQPWKVWRRLLEAVEVHILALAGYIAVSEDAIRQAVKLAALAAAEEVKEEME